MSRFLRVERPLFLSVIMLSSVLVGCGPPSEEYSKGPDSGQQANKVGGQTRAEETQRDEERDDAHEEDDSGEIVFEQSGQLSDTAAVKREGSTDGDGVVPEPAGQKWLNWQECVEQTNKALRRGYSRQRRRELQEGLRAGLNDEEISCHLSDLEKTHLGLKLEQLFPSIDDEQEAADFRDAINKTIFRRRFRLQNRLHQYRPFAAADELQALEEAVARADSVLEQMGMLEWYPTTQEIRDFNQDGRIQFIKKVGDSPAKFIRMGCEHFRRNHQNSTEITEMQREALKKLILAPGFISRIEHLSPSALRALENQLQDLGWANFHHSSSLGE